LERPVVKRFLVVAAVLGISLFGIGAGALLGVMLGTRSLVVSAAAMNPTAPVSIASAAYLGSAPLVVAMGDAAHDQVGPDGDRGTR
jgi:hypothetical protein